MAGGISPGIVPMAASSRVFRAARRAADPALILISTVATAPAFLLIAIQVARQTFLLAIVPVVTRVTREVQYPSRCLLQFHHEQNRRQMTTGVRKLEQFCAAGRRQLRSPRLTQAGCTRITYGASVTQWRIL